MHAPTRILIVDDDADAAEMLAVVLEMRGYEIRVAHASAQALAIAREWCPEVAFLDLGLPDMDGCELAAELQQLPSGVRLIALTGYGQAADRERTRQAGFTAHLVKPVELRMLEATLIGTPAPA